jgi:lipopolysaccharide export LptBFGC system permease protein LptF
MRLQRYLLAELLTQFALIALIVTGIFFAAMLLQFMHNFAQLSLLSILKAAPYFVPLAFPVTLPLSFLIACLLTYGRFADDNEFLAMQMGGIHPWHAAATALVCGAVLAVATLQLNTDVIPFATLAKKQITRGEIRELLRAIDDPQTDQLRFSDFTMSWHGRDARGVRDVLIDWVDERLQPDGTTTETPRHAVASHARVDVAQLDEDLLVLDLDDFEMQHRVGEEVTTLRESNRKIALSLDQLAGEPPSEKQKGSDEMSATQLHYRVRRLQEVESTLSKENADYLRKLDAEYWRRIAQGLAPIAFALVGAALGLKGGRSSRMAAFLTAIVIALPVYYPLLLWGKNLAAQGTLPAPLALNLANIVLVAGALFQLGRVFR